VRPGAADARALPWLDGDLLILDALDARTAGSIRTEPEGVIRVA
jgi:hypothetical protein